MFGSSESSTDPVNAASASPIPLPTPAICQGVDCNLPAHPGYSHCSEAHRSGPQKGSAYAPHAYSSPATPSPAYPSHPAAAAYTSPVPASPASISSHPSTDSLMSGTVECENPSCIYPAIPGSPYCRACASFALVTLWLVWWYKCPTFKQGANEGAGRYLPAASATAADWPIMREYRLPGWMW